MDVEGRSRQMEGRFRQHAQHGGGLAMAIPARSTRAARQWPGYFGDPQVSCEVGSSDRERAVVGAGTSSSCPCSSSVSPMVSSMDWNRPTSPGSPHVRWLHSFCVYKKARTRKTSEARRPGGVSASYRTKGEKWSDSTKRKEQEVIRKITTARRTRRSRCWSLSDTNTPIKSSFCDISFSLSELLRVMCPMIHEIPILLSK